MTIRALLLAANLILLAVLVAWVVAPFAPHASDGAALAEERCYAARGIPEFGWTGAFVRCNWGGR